MLLPVLRNKSTCHFKMGPNKVMNLTGAHDPLDGDKHLVLPNRFNQRKLKEKHIL